MFLFKKNEFVFWTISRKWYFGISNNSKTLLFFENSQSFSEKWRFFDLWTKFENLSFLFKYWTIVLRMQTLFLKFLIFFWICERSNMLCKWKKIEKKWKRKRKYINRKQNNKENKQKKPVQETSRRFQNSVKAGGRLLQKVLKPKLTHTLNRPAQLIVSSFCLLRMTDTLTLHASNMEFVNSLFGAPGANYMLFW